jgi:anti-sigma B factor antagonist
VARIGPVTGVPLSIRSERLGTAQHVAPQGELDIATAELLEAELAGAQTSDADTIVLDLSGLTFIDSTGLRIVLDFNERCERLRVIAGAPAVERLLDVVGLRERLPLISP